MDTGEPDPPPEPQVFGQPPTDADDWTDDQWLEWLRATDSDYPDDRPVTAIGRLTRSGSGEALGQAMLGLANAIYGEKDDKVVVVQERAEPDGDEPFTVRLDPDHPVVVVRPPRPPDDPPPPGGAAPG